jgi:hypothetical protein
MDHLADIVRFEASALNDKTGTILWSRDVDSNVATAPGHESADKGGKVGRVRHKSDVYREEPGGARCRSGDYSTSLE